MQNSVTIRKFARALSLVLLVMGVAAAARAQSTDVAWPSPVRSHEVVGKISARDLGDPRLTDHFYAFTGTPGDVLITVDSRNLNGDIDVFTFSGLRPLLKFSVYAGSSSPTTKSIYLRKTEDLILRVEGRTPNDDEATYRLRFGGSFQAITSGPLAEHEDAIRAAIAEAEPERTGRRVSSVGARIEEPPTEVAEPPVSEPPPTEPIEPAEAEPKAEPARPTRTARGRRPTTRRTRPAPKPKEEAAAAKTETETKETAETAEPESAPPARPTRRGRTRAAAKPDPVEEPEDSGPKLIIETNDGTLIDRFMSSVRRVTVENGQVVVVGKDGKTQKVPLANVVRMIIAP